MLKIRQGQWEALGAQGRTRWCDGVIADVLSEQTSPGRTEPELRATLDRAFDFAAQHGMQGGDLVLRVFALMAHWGDDFARSEKTPWAARVLAWEDSTPAKKLAALEFYGGRQFEAALRERLRGH
jgi:hypothetical protein